MQPPTQESLGIWLNSKSNDKSFYDSPGAIENANYQLLTPMSGTSFTSFQTGGAGGTPSSVNRTINNASLNNVLESASKTRNQATEALNSVKKALQPLDNAPTYVRVSPGHFLLPTTTNGKPAPSSQLLTSAKHLALGSPFSATPPSRGRSHRSGDVVENLAATLKSLGSSSGGRGNNNTSTPTRNGALSFPLATPLSSSSRLGRISNSGGPTTTPGSRGRPSSVNFAPPPPPTTTTTTLPSSSTTPLSTNLVSHKLSELQKRHTELLESCHDAESAANSAKNEKKKAQEELNNASSTLQEVEKTLLERQQNLEEMTAAQHAQHAQLEETIAELATYQAEASETALNLQLAKNESLEMEMKLQALKEELILTQKQALAVQTDVYEAEYASQMLGELQQQVDKATAQLESVLRRQSHAESAALEAENRFIAASSTLQVLESLVSSQNDALVSTEALISEAEALLEEKTAKAAEAQREWEAAEERLGAVDSALVEVTARLEAKRQLVSETEQRCEVLEREMRCADEFTSTAKAAAENAQAELLKILQSVEEARTDESVALEEATKAEARAELACELADAEEQRAEQVAAVVADLERRWQKVEAAEHRLVELQAEIGEAESILELQKQLVVVIDERDALLDELESAQEYGAVASSAAQRAQQLGEEVEAKMQSTLAQSEAVILELEVKLEALRLEEAEQRKGRVEAETLAANSLAEIERLTHSHFSINEAKLLEAELNETREQLTRAANAAETAAKRATLAEKQVECADNQLTMALVERDAALDRVESLCTARDTAVSEIAELKKEAAHREAAFEELSEHQSHVESMVRTMKQERSKAHALTEALNLQVEALQDRLRAESGRRIMLEQMKMSNSRSSSGKRGEKEKKNTSSFSSPAAAHTSTTAPEVEILLAQNATLKATATRLSKALAMALHKSSNSSYSSGGDDEDGSENEEFIPALHSPQKTRRQQQHPWNSSSSSVPYRSHPDSGADLSAVLEQLVAVENLLSSPQR